LTGNTRQVRVTTVTCQVRGRFGRRETTPDALHEHGGNAKTSNGARCFQRFACARLCTVLFFSVSSLKCFSFLSTGFFFLIIIIFFIRSTQSSLWSRNSRYGIRTSQSYNARQSTVSTVHQRSRRLSDNLVVFDDSYGKNP
jgi:hypothetical protein